MSKSTNRLTNKRLVRESEEMRERRQHHLEADQKVLQVAPDHQLVGVALHHEGLRDYAELD